MKPSLSTSAAADLLDKVRAVRISVTEQYVRAVQRNDQNTFKSLRYAKDKLAEIETALDAQQTDDTLSELRTQIEARIKRYESKGDKVDALHRGDRCDAKFGDTNRAYAFEDSQILKLIDSAEARKK